MNMKLNALKTTIRTTALALAGAALLVGFNACQTQTIVQAPAVLPEKPQKAAVKMILDSDFGSSTDDLFALMMLNHDIDDGLVDLKGVVVDREGQKNAELVDLNTGTIEVNGKMLPCVTYHAKLDGNTPVTLKQAFYVGKVDDSTYANLTMTATGFDDAVTETMFKGVSFS